MNTMTPSPTAKTGCRCGNGPSACRCGSAESLPALSGHELRRPVFFPGQLLSETDLDALAGYLTTKLRLRNRYLFGAGVACGLDVSYFNTQSVCVARGYALDGCGNDVILPLAVTVDVIAMVRALRNRRTYTPCPDPLAVPPLPGDERYDLCIRGHETESEFEAPYEFSSSCDARCFPTRVIEGYAFELRRHPEEQTTEPAPRTPSPAEIIAANLKVLNAARSVGVRFEPVKAALPGPPAQTVTDAAKDALSHLPPINEPDNYLKALFALASFAGRVHLVTKPAATWMDTTTPWQEMIAKAKEADDAPSTKGPLSALLNDWIGRFKAAPTDTDFNYQAAVVGEPVSIAMVNEAGKAIAELARLLPDGYGETRPPAFQDLRKTVASWKDFAPVSGTDWLVDFRKYIVNAEVFAELLAQASTQPPCCSTADICVRLATITVRVTDKSDEIFDVCSATRSILDTPANLEYWAEHHVRPWTAQKCESVADRTQRLQLAEAAEEVQWQANLGVSSVVITETGSKPIEEQAKENLDKLDQQWKAANGDPAKINILKEEFKRVVNGAGLAKMSAMNQGVPQFVKIDQFTMQDIIKGESLNPLPLMELTLTKVKELSATNADKKSELEAVWLAAQKIIWLDKQRKTLTMVPTFNLLV